ncbi:hypothetical protein [Bacillus cihuensis]|uniref:hypothetical protein n=1 Tax=Bacillus cihuensis TaxID=1208599 RepID=UPI0003FCF3CD|nr:hypothetical protein [Bacillus cihuensis]
MSPNHTLNILNGQSMYHYFKKTHFLNKEMMIPFNEAMCFGPTSSQLFSDTFIALRAKVHHITAVQYEEITIKPLYPLFHNDFTHLRLWFDTDMFCQMNLLTILAWLDQTNHSMPIDLHIVGHHFELLEKFTLEPMGYYELYKQVLVHKIMPKCISPPPLKKGVELYLTYLHKDSDLMLYIQQHQNVPEKQLVPVLLEKFTEYGLGDTQYMELIQSSRKKSDNQTFSHPQKNDSNTK